MAATLSILTALLIGLIIITQYKRLKQLRELLSKLGSKPIGIIKDLTDNNEKFRLLVEKSQDGIVIAQNVKFIYVNQAFCNYLGYTAYELYEMDPTTLLAKNDKDRVMQYYNDRMAGKLDSLRYSTVFIKKDGNPISFEMNSTTIEFNGKKATYVSVRDITENIRLQQILFESEAKYRMLVEKSNDGICITQGGMYKFVNPALCRMVGYTEEELYNMPGTVIIAPEYREKMLEIHKKRMDGDISSINYKVKLLRKDGGLVDIDAISSTLTYNGSPAGFFTLHDVSESNRLQQTLIESETIYRTLIEKSLDGVALTQDAKILLFNDAFCDIFGYTRDEMEHIYTTDLIAPEDRERIVDIHYKRMHGELETYNYSGIFLNKKGERMTVEINSATVQVKGKYASFVSLRDITKRLAIENALRVSESKFRTLVDKALDGIIITQNGLFKFVNQAFCNMMQYTEAELLDTPYLNVVVPDNHNQMVDYHKRRMEGEEFQVIYRSNIIRKDGSIIIVELNSRTSEFDGKPAAFIITRDITERLKIEDELRLAKDQLELLNNDLEKRVNESSQKLTEARTQLINVQKENLQSQFEVLKQQVNPHFLFNSLNVLTSLIKLEPDLAENFSEQLSKVYRYVLENKDNELVSIKTELDFLKSYIFLLDIRFVDKLKVNIKIEEKELDLQIIPLAMQLLIENAIKHNTMSKKEPLIIDIFIDETMKLNIVNKLQERESQIISTGVGLKNIQNRYLLLNNTEPEFIKTTTQFIAKIPLLKNVN
jgi:PAS domain S-box-containing protein